MEMLEWVISSAVLTALVIALRFVLKGKISLRLQYTLWALVLLRLLVPVSFGATGLSVGNLTHKAAETETAQVLSALTQLELPRMPYSAAYSEVAKEYVGKGVDIAEMPVEEYERVDYEILSRMGGEWNIRDILKAVWILGIAAVGFVLLVSNARFAAKLKKSRHRLDGHAYPLPVYISPEVDTPCLFGLFRPVIYITPEAAADDTILRHTTQHELTHYRHGDHIWSLLRGACLALHWYNPLVWWAAILSRNDAELACDEATIKRIGENERAEYGRTLIGMTCQKRSALLLTATTMTGSKSSIKERIMLIAKKPKTAIYTLVAVLLIAAVAVGCTFTGANTDTPWAWAQSIDANDASVYIWYSKNNEKQLTDTEKETLISMLNSLKQGNFTQNKELAGITPGYGLRITTDGAEYYINEADAQSGSLEMNYGGKQWWINSDELDRFISALTTGEGQELSVKAEVDGDIPKAVIDYATDYTRTQLLYYTDDLGYDITEAKIVGLTQTNTGTAGLDNGINMYCLEYRLLAADPEEVMLAGGMQMDGDYITEWGSTGQPYLLLHWQDNDSETMWERICVTNTDIITQDYGTPEMIEQYGDMYTAAAMELYKKYERGKASLVPEAIEAVLLGDAEFYETGIKEQLNINQLNRAVSSDSSITAQATKYAIIDLDDDGVNEVVLQLTVNGNDQYGVEILHCIDGTVYGYLLWNRAFYNLRSDGTFSYSGGASSHGFSRIEFTEQNYLAHTITFSESGYDSNNNLTVNYFVNNLPSTREEFDAALEEQERKSNTIWYDFPIDSIPTASND